MIMDPRLNEAAQWLRDTTAPLWTLSPSVARTVYRSYHQTFDFRREAIGAIQDLAINRDAETSIPARLYTPIAAGAGALPLLVFYHGGGWVLGDIETHDLLCRSLVNQSGIKILSVGYRCAPEHPFPTAVDDAIAALQWIEREAATYGVDANSLAVGGDSAGGNLAAIVAQNAAKRRASTLRCQILIYPILFVESEIDHDENKKNDDPFFKTQLMRWFINHYLPPEQDRRDPRISPLYAENLSGLAPAYIVSAGIDPLYAEAKTYAQALHDAGIPCIHQCYEPMAHGFFNLGQLGVAEDAIQKTAAYLKEALF